MNSEELRDFVINFLDNHVHGALLDSFNYAVMDATMAEDEQTREDLFEEFENYVVMYRRL